MKKRGYSVTALLLSFVMALSVTVGSFSVPAFAEGLETVETVETVEIAEESEAINEAAEETEAAVEIEAVGEDLIEASVAEITEEEVINEEVSDGIVGIHYSWEEEESEGWFTERDNYVEIPFEEGLSLLDIIYANFSGDLSDISGWYAENYVDGELISSPITEDTVAEKDFVYSVYPHYNKVDVQFSFLPYEEGGVDYANATIEVDENTTLDDIVAYVPKAISEDSRFVSWRIAYPSDVTQICKERYLQVYACYGVLSIDVHFYYYGKNGELKESIQALEYDSNVESESAVLEKIVIPEDAMEGTTYTNGSYSIDFERTKIRTCADGCCAVLVYVDNGYDYEEYGLYKGGKLIKLPLQYEGLPLEGWHYGYHDENGEWITDFSYGALTLPKIEGCTELYLVPCYDEYEESEYLLLSLIWNTYDEMNGIDYHYDTVYAEKRVGDRLLDVINESFDEEIPYFDGWFIGSYDDDGNRILTPVTENRVVTRNDDFIELFPAYNKTTIWFSFKAIDGSGYGKDVTVDVDDSTTIEDLLMYAPVEAEENPEFEGWKFDYSGKVNADRVIFAEGKYGVQEAKVKFLYQDKNGELKFSEQNLSYDSNCGDIFEVVDYITIPEDAEEGAQVSRDSGYSFSGDIFLVKEAGLEAFCLLGPGESEDIALFGAFRPGETIELPTSIRGNEVLNWYSWEWKDGVDEKVDHGFTFTFTEVEDYDSEWVITLYGEISGDIHQITRYVTLFWEEYNEEIEWFDSFEQTLAFNGDFDVKILDAIEENFAGDLSNISGWYYWNWNEETEDYEQISITEDTTVEDIAYSTISPFYKRLYVQFHYPSNDWNDCYGTFVDVNENTTVEDILAWAPEEAKNNPEIEGWIVNNLEPNERIDSQSSLWITVDLGIQEITVVLVYRGKDGKIKEDYQTFEYDTATTTEGELLSMLVIPEDAEEGSELPVLADPDGIIGFVNGMLSYTLGDFTPIYMMLQLEDSEETLGICECGDFFELPAEYEGRKIVGWSYEYYNWETEEWLSGECDFIFTVPETDGGIWFYPAFEEEISDVKNGIYEEDGVLYYYENDERVYAGLIQIDDDFYYVHDGGIVSTGSYYITHGNDIMDKGHAQFGPDGKMILNGIVKIRDEYYYYENSRPVENLGLIFWNQYHYYIGEGGKAMTGMVDVVNANGIVNEGIHEFGEDGKMVLDGIVMINGKLRYYVGGAMRSQAGMIKIGDDMYYVGASAEVATGKRSVGSRHNNLVTPGMHYFDEVTGKLIY